MPTFQTSAFLAEIVDGKAPIPAGTLAYFSERLRNKLYDLVVGGFLEKERAGELNKAQLARRIDKPREQITRWLASPGNWELETLSALTLGIFGGELTFSVKPFNEAAIRNSSSLAMLDADKTFYAKPSTASQSSTKETVWVGHVA